MFKFRVGEDVRIQLTVGATDTINGVDTITAKITPVRGGTETSMNVTPRTNPLGWDIVLPTNALAVGRYIVDAKITYNNGVVDITEQSAHVEITRGALT